jgi:hypothetical protein
VFKAVVIFAGDTFTCICSISAAGIQAAAPPPHSAVAAAAVDPSVECAVNQQWRLPATGAPPSPSSSLFQLALQALAGAAPLQAQLRPVGAPVTARRAEVSANARAPARPCGRYRPGALHTQLRVRRSFQARSRVNYSNPAASHRSGCHKSSATAAGCPSGCSSAWLSPAA